MVKFMWNGIKVGATLYKGYYGKTYPTEKNGIIPGCIWIQASTYDHFPTIPRLGDVKNETDLMTDYFEKDRILVSPRSIHYAEVKAAKAAYEEHSKKMWANRHNKYAAAHPGYKMAQ